MTAEWVAFITALTGCIVGIAWPLVVLIALYRLREPLAKFVSELGGRATKVSVFQFSVELATIPEFKPTYVVGYETLRNLTPSTAFDSGTTTLFEQISDVSASDYAIIDLGVKEKWLTSRLYIFALMLGRMRNLKCLVFLETRGEVRRVFLGSATPDQIRWTLAQKYPWLEAAFVHAYSGAIPNPANMATANDPFIFSDHGALIAYKANDLVQHYVDAIQQNVEPPPPLPNEPEEWIPLYDTFNNPYWERTAWLDGDLRANFLVPVLQTASVVDSVDIPAETRVRSILRRSAAFVALVDQNGVFQALVDRQELLDQVAKKLAAPTENGS